MCLCSANTCRHPPPSLLRWESVTVSDRLLRGSRGSCLVMLVARLMLGGVEKQQAQQGAHLHRPPRGKPHPMRTGTGLWSPDGNLPGSMLRAVTVLRVGHPHLLGCAWYVTSVPPCCPHWARQSGGDCCPATCFLGVKSNRSISFRIRHQKRSIFFIT